ncbi:MAG: HAMP domain-containing protein [Acidobacteriota bacterium]|nr:HAMP domain-containing protein [Blastocatellia bacterium]MDW8412678.1 HAMP domain-containing protein [Acidobacteriota bacterium]
MKLMIKQKLIIFAALLILIPMLLSAALIGYIVNSNIESQSALSVEKDARVAEQLYKSRLLTVLQAAQNSAQALSAQNLLESAPSSGGGDSKSTVRISDAARRRVKDIVEGSIQASNLDFVVIVDATGKIIHPQQSDAAASVKDNPLFIAVQNSVAAKKIDALASSVKEPATALKYYAGEELAKQASVKGEGPPLSEGLVIEAAAPIISTNGDLRGMVLAGLLINNAKPEKSLADYIKKTLYPELLDSAGAVIALGDTVVSGNLPIQQGGGIGTKIKRKDLKDVPSAGTEMVGQQEYKTAYAPVKDINSQVIGRVGVEIKQSWFNAVLNRVLIIIFLIVVFFLIVATVVAVFAAQRLTRPIVELTEASHQISLGKLDQAIQIKSEDEIGQLAEALERMRISLKQALERLRARRGS